MPDPIEVRKVPILTVSDASGLADLIDDGVLDADRNVAYRSTFVIDRDGMLRWGQAGDRHMVRDGSELLRVVNLIDKLRQTS